MDKNKKIIEEYFQHLGEGNIPALFSLFDVNVKWHQPGNNKFSGIKNNLNEVGQMIGEMMEDSLGSLKVELKDELMANGELVSAPIQFSAKKEKKSIDMKGIDLFRIINEKIVEVWLFSQFQEKEDQFWD